VDIAPNLLQRGGLLLDIDGERATITLNRPDALNAQLPSMWRALRQIGERLDPDVRVVVVRGSGRSFSAGLDRRMFARDGIPGEVGLLEIASAGPDAGEAILDGFQRGFTWLADPQRGGFPARAGL
jgi:enoyl-CoA hydratase/carnithine racemase